MPNSGRRFGWGSRALEVLENFDLNGKTVLITGASSGIGKETARALAYHNAHVVMACRNLQTAQNVKEEIISGYNQAKIDVIFMDSSQLKTVESCAEEFISNGWPLHVLILNAGVSMPPVPFTPDGFEWTFQVNYLSTFYLVKLLEPVLLRSAPSRIVHVSSSTHKLSGRFDSKDIEWTKLSPQRTINGVFNTFELYYRSKACVCLFSNELQRKLGAFNVTSNSLHPGVARTEISRNNLFVRLYFKLPFVIFFRFPNADFDLVKSKEQCAATVAYCATAPELENVGGRYFVNCKMKNPNPSVMNEETAKKLWQLSEEMIHKWKTAPPGTTFFPYVFDKEDESSMLFKMHKKRPFMKKVCIVAEKGFKLFFKILLFSIITFLLYYLFFELLA